MAETTQRKGADPAKRRVRPTAEAGKPPVRSTRVGSAVKTGTTKPKSAASSKPVTAASRSATAASKPVVRPKPGTVSGKAVTGAGVRPERTDNGKKRKPATTPTARPGVRKQTTKKRRRKKRESIPSKILSSFVLTILLVGLIVFVRMQDGNKDEVYDKFKMMVAEVDHERYYDGIVIDGVNVAGMTLDEAKQHWAQEIEPEYGKCTVSLDNGTSYSAAELGYHSNYIEVLETAFGSGRAGTLEERYQALREQREKGVTYEIERVPYSPKRIEEVVQRIAKFIDLEPVDSKISYLDTEDLTFSFTKEADGQRLDAAKLTSDIQNALENGGGSVQLSIETLKAKNTRESNRLAYGMIASAETDASSSNENRLANIKLACSILNGLGVGGGNVFSFNDAIGQRTEERGFQVAAAYLSGNITNEVGGGICQVSTTLMNAVVKANMNVLERHPHSMPVSYVDPGRDAAVNWRSLDFRFKNTTTDSIYIRAYVTKKKHIVIEIYGRLIENGKTIDLQSEIGEPIPYETERVPNEEMKPDKEEVTRKGKDGVTAKTYKVIYNADGTISSRQLLFDSRYNAMSEIIEFGPPEETPLP